MKRGGIVFLILSFTLLTMFGLVAINGCSRASAPIVEEQTKSPVIGEVKISDAGRFVVSGNYAYVASDAGMYIIDISDPVKPTLVATAEINNFNRYDIALYGNYVYMTGYISESGYVTGEYIYVFDVSDPLQPKLVKRVNADGSYNICVDNNKMYAVAAYSGLLIYDLTSPEAPSLEVYSINSLSLDDIVVSGNYAYVADYFYGFKAIRLSSIETDYKEVRLPIDKANRLTLSGNYVYVLEYGGKLHIIDISTPESPVEINTYAGSYSSIFVEGNFLYLGSSLLILDISDKRNIKLFNNIGVTAYCIYTRENYIYIVGNDRFSIIDKSKL